MKKILSAALVLISLLSSLMATAQTFTTAHDTVNVSIGSTGSGTFYNHITNLTTQPINIRWSAQASHDFPVDWIARTGICDAELCHYDVGPHTTTDTPYKPSIPGLFDLTLDSFNLVSPGTHYMTITLRDMTSASGTTTHITYIVNNFPTGIAKTTKAYDNVTLYPNPAIDELNVRFDPDAGIKMITVYNVIGKAVTVYKLSSNASAKLDAGSLPPGIYFIRLTNGQGQVVATRKFTHQ